MVMFPKMSVEPGFLVSPTRAQSQKTFSTFQDRAILQPTGPWTKVPHLTYEVQLQPETGLCPLSPSSVTSPPEGECLSLGNTDDIHNDELKEHAD